MDPPHPVIVTIMDNEDYIRVLLYSYYTTITGWGVLLTLNLVFNAKKGAGVNGVPALTVVASSEGILCTLGFKVEGVARCPAGKFALFEVGTALNPKP